LVEDIKTVISFREPRYNLLQLCRRLTLFRFKHHRLQEASQTWATSMVKIKDYKDKKLWNQKMRKSN
jgi:hypothetical protein